jgi:REP element-mobilizing transposase RayT
MSEIKAREPRALQNDLAIRLIGSYVPFMERKHPAHWPAVERHNEPVIIFVTVCTKNREPVLANEFMHHRLIAAWKSSKQWMAGRYLIMPDHIHLFCAPAVYEAENVTQWVAYWKRLVSGHYSGGTAPASEEAREAAGPPNLPVLEELAALRPVPFPSSGGTLASASPAREAAGPPQGRCPPLWQKDCWDTQLRRAESYSEKWEYVRQNPVRAGLVANPDDWPYQGVLNTLRW